MMDYYHYSFTILPVFIDVYRGSQSKMYRKIWLAGSKFVQQTPLRPPNIYEIQIINFSIVIYNKIVQGNWDLPQNLTAKWGERCTSIRVLINQEIMFKQTNNYLNVNRNPRDLKHGLLVVVVVVRIKGHLNWYLNW